MRPRVTRRAVVLGAAGLLVVGMAGCSQSKPGSSDANKGAPNLKIVEQVEIDENGQTVPTTQGAQPVDPAGDGKATCEPVALAMAGALTGPDSALGINILNGAKLAVDKHNQANPGCQVELITFDTGGVEQTATGIAPQIIDNPKIRGLIGPAFSGETEATGNTFNQAGLVAATASATRVSLSQNGWKTFFRGLANDGVQGPAVANYMKNALNAKKICIVDDSTAYGQGLAENIRNTLGPLADASCAASIKKGDKDFSATVTKISGAAPDAVFFSGYYTEAALLAQQMRDAGVKATFVAGDGSKDQQFVDQAGNASKDAVLSCPCGPAPDWFAKEYTAKSNQAPGTYSTEGYDLATIMVRGIDAGKASRPDLLEWLRTYNGPGVARNYQWTDTGELTTKLVWIYKVQ
ncbi:MAG: branched-chain amino acid ABC transporter substrate-binding protein [Mycobacteriaceae bacterium]|nr:branched-chain amino acid ABC transporter substrate-binding protein [Mycobacteriaceae bacterium]